ncbi:MAG TPA: PIG-L family deacetylase [Vicinamibacterales bacterium]|nr:PIG-L family deacetylase [Vicinamibacterales bacterium]
MKPLTVFACLALAACTVGPAAADDTTPRAQGSVHVSRATRAIIVSPHPDDGVLGAGGLIQRIVARGGSVQIIEMTSGDAFPKGVAAVRRVASPPTADAYRWYGTVREREVVRAMKALGVARSRVRLLGFPDEGLCQLADAHGANTVFASPYTRRDSPPAPEKMLADAKYRGADARQELENLFVAFRPNLIVTPDGHDEHPDHCATRLLVHDAIAGATSRGIRPPTVLHYLIHYRDWPADPTHFPAQDAFKTLRLTDGERARKREAVHAYRTQMSVMAAFMTAFDTPDERFIVGQHEAPAACWCAGTNIAPPPVNSR